MITRITKENVNKYNALFKEAVLALQSHNTEGKPIESNGGVPMLSISISYEPVALTEESYIDGFHYIKVGEGSEDYELTKIGDPFKPEQEYAIRIESSEKITTLEEYFCHIADLSILTDDIGNSIGRRFLILPVENDENFFEINANTREITVPEVFKQNGVSVQGDAIAEMLYFRIDRYFDMDDLGEKDVYIEWKLPVDPETKERAVGASRPFIVDTSIEADHVIIGWPIHQKLTKIPGKIEFALRFFDIGEDKDGPYKDKLVYSFSTLPAEVEIKPSLNLDVEKIYIDESALNSDDLIGSRIENSLPKDDASPMPEAPIWFDSIFENLPQPVEEVVDDGNESVKTYKAYLTNNETGEEVDGLFIVQAKVTDAGRLSYTWIKRDAEGEVIMNHTQGEASVFVEAEKDEEGAYVDEAPDRSYYTSEDAVGNYVEFIFTAEMATPRQAQLAGYVLYERKARITMNHKEPNVLGSYQARAINRLGRKTAKAFSDIVLIEGPEAPVITKDDQRSALFSDEALDVKVQIEADVDEHAYTTYALWRLTEDGDVKVNSNKTGEFVIDGKPYDEAEPEADIGDGSYWIIVTSHLNSVDSSVAGEKIRVTHKASPVSIVNSEPTYTSGSNIYDINLPLSVTVTPHASEKRTEDDKIEYQWYMYNGPTGNQAQINKDLADAEQGIYQVHVGLDKPLIGETSAVLKIQNTAERQSGNYFCEVTNTYNGDKSVKCSKFFNVLDTEG